MRYRCLELLDRDVCIISISEKAQDLELINLSLMRVSNRIILPSDAGVFREKQAFGKPGPERLPEKRRLTQGGLGISASTICVQSSICSKRGASFVTRVK